MLSAFARLLATVLRRTDCADMPEPATSKILNEGIYVSFALLSGQLLTGNRGHEAAEPVVQERERCLEAHRVFREVGLLHLHVDGVAVEGGSHRHSVLEGACKIGVGFAACINWRGNLVGVRRLQR